MLSKTRPEYLNEHFQESVRKLERITRKAQLIQKIERMTRETKNANAEQLTEIMAEIEECREEIRLLYQQGS